MSDFTARGAAQNGQVAGATLAHDLTTNDLIRLAGACPKAELHLHLEGTLEPELMFELAARNGVELHFDSVDALRDAYRFSNLQEFLDIYYEGTAVLITEQDFYDLTYAYVVRAHADHVVHVEPFFDPQAHTARGVELETVVRGIVRALADARAELGVTSHLIMSFLRDRPANEAAEILEQALALPSELRSAIVGVGLDSTELGNPPAKFQQVFARAREAGLHCVAHAGEEGTAADVVETIDVLRVARIDHGVHAADDPAVVEMLAERQIPLTVCPLSNVALKVYGDMSEHSLASLLDAGVVVTINSDDPAYFGGYINENYRAAIEGLGLTPRQVKRLLVHSFEGSFLPRFEKAAHIAEIDAKCDR